MKVVAAVKAGRCVNGGQADHGQVYHALPQERAHFGAKTKALCGTETGRRSVGFVCDKGVVKVTCKRCLAKIEKKGYEIVEPNDRNLS